MSGSPLLSPPDSQKAMCCNQIRTGAAGGPAVPTISCAPVAGLLLRLLRDCEDPQERLHTLEALHHLLGELPACCTPGVNQSPSMHSAASSWSAVRDGLQPADSCVLIFGSQELVASHSQTSAACKRHPALMIAKAVDRLHLHWSPSCGQKKQCQELSDIPELSLLSMTAQGRLCVVCNFGIPCGKVSPQHSSLQWKGPKRTEPASSSSMAGSSGSWTSCWTAPRCCRPPQTAGSL